MTDTEIDAIRRMLAARPRPADLAERRQRLDGLGAQYPLPADVRVEPVVANGVAAEWTATPGADPARVVLFLHGGGYVSGSLLSHRHMVAQAGREAGARTLALGYRLAPEHPFPAALEDAVAGYRFLLSHGFAPRRIALAGESAGGGLAVAALVRLRDARLIDDTVVRRVQARLDAEEVRLSVSHDAESRVSRPVKPPGGSTAVRLSRWWSPGHMAPVIRPPGPQGCARAG
jgi:acetyl esterase/lipase